MAGLLEKIDEECENHHSASLIRSCLSNKNEMVSETRVSTFDDKENAI